MGGVSALGQPSQYTDYIEEQGHVLLYFTVRSSLYTGDCGYSSLHSLLCVLEKMLTVIHFVVVKA